MKKLGRERNELGVILVQIETPSYGIDVTSAIFNIIKSDNWAYGTYHYNNGGVASLYDFARTIFDMGEITVKLNPILGSATPTEISRPAFSLIGKSKINEEFKLEIPYWRKSLIRCIQELNRIG